MPACSLSAGRCRRHAVRRVPDPWSLNMTASVAAGRLRARVRCRSTEGLVFGMAAVLALAHAFDDALLAPGAGVPLSRHGFALAIALFATVAAIVRFEAMRPGARAATALTFGVLAA